MADVGIAGAGLAGSLLRSSSPVAADVTLYERRGTPPCDAAGRSINLALSAGIGALERVGLAEDVLARALAMRGRMVRDRDGELAFQAYSADGSKSINSISPMASNTLLLDAAEKEAGVILRFEERAVGIVAEAGQLTLDGPEGHHDVTHDVVMPQTVPTALPRPVVRTGAPTIARSTCRGATRELTIAPTRRRVRPRSWGLAHLAARRLR